MCVYKDDKIITISNILRNENFWIYVVIIGVFNNFIWWKYPMIISMQWIYKIRQIESRKASGQSKYDLLNFLICECNHTITLYHRILIYTIIIYLIYYSIWNALRDVVVYLTIQMLYINIASYKCLTNIKLSTFTV